MKFKLKPIWLYQSQEDGEIEWVGEHVDEIVDNLPNINIQNLEFIPII
jgi:protoheme ferro-lyase